ncbi:MAG TPA: hypothetical protein VGJ05_02365 [Fimbriiglobus sp.]|jgi:hypothetical protein
METADFNERLLQEFRESNRVLAEEVRGIRAYFDYVRQQQARLKKQLVYVVLGFPVIVILVLAVLIGGIRLIFPDPAENPWEKQFRQQQEHLDRTGELLDRAEKLADRADNLLRKWEKGAPK